MDASRLLQMGIILLSGLVAGFINTLAGGGSFLTLAALELAGLSSVMANATNRPAILVQNALAVMGFRSKGVSNFKLSLHFAIPALFGALLGADRVKHLPELVFHRALAAAMLMMLAILVFNPKRWLQGRQVTMTGRRRWLGYAVFFLIGIYGGAIQAGVGFFLIASLVIFAGLDLVKTNSHKVFVIATYTLAALLVFGLRGEIDWLLGLVLAVGNGAGAWIASRLAAEKGEEIVRVVMMLALTVLSVRYLDLIPGF